MLMIRYKGQEASWDSGKLQWQSGDQEFEDIINETIPERARDVPAAFRKGGPGGIALKELRTVLGEELEVIKPNTHQAPEEVEGMED